MLTLSPTHAAYRVSRDLRLSVLSYSRHAATAILANVWRRNRSYLGVILQWPRRYLGQIGPDRRVGYWWFAAELAVKDFGATAKRMKVEIVTADELSKTDSVANKVSSTWLDVGKVDVIVDLPAPIALAGGGEIAGDEQAVHDGRSGAPHRPEMQRQHPPVVNRYPRRGVLPTNKFGAGRTDSAEGTAWPK
jgi:hypothetical protein